MNIFLLIADDAGWPHWGFMQRWATGTYPHLDPAQCYRAPIYTPHLDRIASEGAVFPYGHSMVSICRPTIRAFLTGKYTRHVATIPGSNKLDLDVNRILPQFMREMGYAGLHAGKWYEDKPVTIGFTSQDGGWKVDSPNLFRTEMQQLYDFPSRSWSPWWVYAMPKMPHTPHGGWPADIDALYPKMDGKRDYKCMVSWFDQRVGELRAFLESIDKWHETLFVFFVDNGYGLGNAKDNFAEDGVRTPFIIAAPEIVPGVYPQLVNTIDVTLTLLDYAGLQPPGLEGRTLKALLETGPGGEWPAILYEQSESGGMIAAQDMTRWKVYTRTRNLMQPDRVFDLAQDPFENSNLWNGNSSTQPVKDAVARLLPGLAQWWLEE